MAKVILDISMSLDGYVAAAGTTPEDLRLEPVATVETAPAVHLRFRVLR
jgi:hypothetical protein